MTFRCSGGIGDWGRKTSGDPYGYPHEDGEVYHGQDMQILMLDDVGDGYRIGQIMTFKLQKTQRVCGRSCAKMTIRLRGIAPVVN